MCNIRRRATPSWRDTSRICLRRCRCSSTRSGGSTMASGRFWFTPEGLLAAPTPEHYLPLLYVLGAQQPDDELLIVNEGIDHGSISVLAFAFV